VVLVFETRRRRVWSRVKPLFQKLLPVNPCRQALLAGMAWGWLPCGLCTRCWCQRWRPGVPPPVPRLMLAFGLGTLPNLLGMGLFARQIQPFMQQCGYAARPADGSGFGVWGLLNLVYSAFSNT